METNHPTNAKLLTRGRRLLARVYRKLCQRFFASHQDFDRVAQSAQALRCDLQYVMDIDPSSPWFSQKFVSNFGGFHPPGDTRVLNRLHPGDRVRSDMLLLLLREIIIRKVPGAMAELGVHRGTSARLLHHYCPERKLYLFDTFTGFAAADFAKESIKIGYNQQQQFTDTDVDIVLRAISPRNANTIPIVGWFPASVTPEVSAENFAFVHLDADLEAPIAAGLDFFWPRVNAGGFVVVHDYNAWPGARLAVDHFLSGNRAAAVPMPDKSGSIVLVKT
jgi:O-methyltransferase